MDKTAESKNSGQRTLIQSLKRAGTAAAFIAACFFMGRAQIFSQFQPFVIAGAGVTFLEGKKFYIAAAASLLGLATRFSVTNSIRYIIALGVLWLLNMLLSGRKADIFFKCAVIGAAMFFSGLILALVRGLTTYTLMVSVLEGVLAFSLTLILTKGRDVLAKFSAEPLTGEELVCASFLAGGIVMGAADIWAGPFSLRYALCAYLILLVQKTAGQAAIIAGLVLGVLINAAGYEGHGFSLVLAISALVCGFIKTDNRIISAAAFTAVSSVLALYFGLFGLGFVLSFTLAGALFALIPVAAHFAGSKDVLTRSGTTAAEYYNRVSELTAKRLRASALSFSNLAKTFGGHSKPRTGLTMPEARNLLDDVIAKTCTDCVKNYVCWEQDFYVSYQKAFDSLKNCDLVPVSETEANPIMDFCIKRKEFTANIRFCFELYRNDLKWRNYLSESRSMAGVQLSAAAGIIGDLSTGLKFTGRFDFEGEKKLLQAYAKKNAPVKSCFVTADKDGRCEAEVVHKSCGGNHKCAEYAAIAAEALGREMRNRDRECTLDKSLGRSVCCLHLAEESRFRAVCGAACLAASAAGESGDSYSHAQHRSGRVQLVLSDGMGKGREAAVQSRATVELFEDFMEAGFRKDVAARLINSALLLKSAEGGENFSTLDVCSIDTHTGRAEFLKVGAAASFIVGQNKEVEAISSYSLPVGILDSVEPEGASRRCKHGDIIIMMTDGVLDSAAGGMGTEQKEEWIAAAMRKLTSHKPRHIAEHILALAKKDCGGEPKDDMTVLVARVWEKG